MLVEGAADGKVSGEELDKAIEDTKAEIAKLKAAGLTKEAEALEEMLHDLEAAREAEKAKKEAQHEKEMLDAEAACKVEIDDVVNITGMLEVALTAAGMNEGAAEVRRLRELLENDDGSLTGTELEKAAADAHELAKKLREAGHGQLAEEAEAMTEKLLEAANAKLAAEVLEQE